VTPTQQHPEKRFKYVNIVSGQENSTRSVVLTSVFHAERVDIFKPVMQFYNNNTIVLYKVFVRNDFTTLEKAKLLYK